MDFLADFSQHIPKPHEHQVCYAGAFANTLQMLSVPKNGPEAVATPTPTPQSRFEPMEIGDNDEASLAFLHPSIDVQLA